MIQKLAAILGIDLFLAAILTVGSLASVPKVIVIEEFGATW